MQTSSIKLSDVDRQIQVYYSANPCIFVLQKTEKNQQEEAPSFAEFCVFGYLIAFICPQTQST
jgi:hypothetical protein